MAKLPLYAKFDSEHRQIVATHAYSNVDSLVHFSQTSDVLAINTTTDIWDFHTLKPVLVPLTVDTPMEAVSSSANDSAAGTGVQALLISGISGGLLVSEMILTNGLTPVPTANSYTSIWRVLSVGVGSAGTAQGNIRIRTLGGTLDSDVYAFIRQADEDNRSLMSHYTVPDDKQAVITKFSAGCNRAGDANIKLKTRFHSDTAVSPWITSYSVNAYQNTLTRDFLDPAWLPPGTDVKITAKTATNNVQVAVAYTLVLRDIPTL